MPAISDQTLQWARQTFQEQIADLLDDPAHLLHPWRTCEPAEALAALRALSTDLGLDFEALLREAGTDYEITRLRRIESGEIKPETHR